MLSEVRMTSRVGYPMYVCALLAAAAVLSGTAAAQGRGALVEAIGTTEPDPLPPGGPAPRMADGRPDLSGVWFSGVIGRPSAWSRTRREPLEEEPVPVRPEVKAKLEGMTRTEIQLLSPGVNCLPLGVPGVFVSNPHPFQIITIPGMFVQLIEVSNDWRLVYTDKRPHPEYPDPLFYGNSSAWWEGDTLVIDSIAIDERTWVMNNGWYHSDQLRIVERIRRPSRNYLEYQFTAEDPKVLTRPWTSGWRKYSLSQEADQLFENFCTNNQNPEQFKKLLDLEVDRKR
ncbi:MAG: hypothetical protein A3I61_08015 [Acidobacteria bacterium RIFCSPLOWO2_02_FULL_68_18]|nr:MAG: hypothetical protein A3I61_08015 [Acidobacteria bacterium RIFCSPLOWO2_02_FULL_68_18]OFW51188.1 MAG: hypothetical protein A3G77_06115 [Acidobacteria bacterium RIFCSPLOWO2_12_FULL_68_19]